MRSGCVRGDVLLVALCLVLTMGAPMPGMASDDWQDNEPRLRYGVEIEGVEERALRRRLQAASITMRQRAARVSDAETLAWRGGRDAEIMRELLMAEGYRRAAVSLSVREARRGPPLRLRFMVATGPRYVIGTVDVEGLDGVARREIERLSRSLEGSPARSISILRVESDLVDILRADGYARASVRPRRVIVRHDKDRVDVIYKLYAGPPGYFGRTSLVGLEKVREKAVERKLPWHAGERFDARRLETGRERLLDSGLFLAARVVDQPEEEHEAALDPDESSPMPSTASHSAVPGEQELTDLVALNLEPEADVAPERVDVDVILTERRHRSVGLGLHYYSDEGIASRVFWEHRNVLGHGENVRFDIRHSVFLAQASALLRIPDYRRFDHELTLRLRRTRESTDIYDSYLWDVEAGLDRPLSKRFRGGIGVGLMLAQVWQDDEPREHYNLVYLPLALTFDDTDSHLNPTRGSRVVMRFAPYVDMLDPIDGMRFTKNHVQIELHQSLSGRDRVVVAWRGSVGAIMGVGSTESIPADQRFYAGGGGSVRGYAYKKLGPERDGRPTGGRTLLETSAELRTRWSESWGAVLFVDGGSVYESVLPDARETIDELRWSVGLGLRWFTGVGPLRLDLAFPLQRDSGRDDPFTLYIGLGQAF